MKFTKLSLALATFALAVASAGSNTYHLTLDNSAWFGSTQLKAGEYKIHVEGDKAVITAGKKDVAEVPVKVEQGDHKVMTNQILMRSENNKQQVQEIRLGGTTTRLVIQGGTKAAEY